MEKDTTESKNEHTKAFSAIESLLEKNSELIAENNKLLKKIHRHGVIAFWIRIVWYLLLIGFPFALYFYVLEPYFAAFGSSYGNFIDGLNELPGLRGIDTLLNRE